MELCELPALRHGRLPCRCALERLMRVVPPVVADAAADTSASAASVSVVMVAATFTRWDWVKAPIRHLHYDVLNRCRTYDYTEERAEAIGEILA